MIGVRKTGLEGVLVIDVKSFEDDDKAIGLIPSNIRSRLESLLNE